jgi:hypothetical protein
MKLKTSGVFRVTCACGQDYIGQTNRSIEASIKKHQRHVRLGQTDKSAVTEHSVKLGCRVNVQDIAILCTKATCMNRLIREATEIELQPKT